MRHFQTSYWYPLQSNLLRTYFDKIIHYSSQKKNTLKSVSKIHMEKYDENTNGNVSVNKENTHKKVSVYKENTNWKDSVYKKNTHEKVSVLTCRFWYKISPSADLWYIYIFNKNSNNITIKIL